MKTRHCIIAAMAFIGAIFFYMQTNAQELPAVWNLSSCIDYALANNIDIRKSKLSLQEAEASTKQAKAQLYPNLSASIGQQFGNNAFVQGSSFYSGSYDLNASMTLYSGGINLKNIRQQKLYEEVGANSVAAAELDIRMSLLQVYMQILYADEAVNINKNTLETSEYQVKRGSELLKAGSISQSDFAQLESQLASDKYQLVVSENNLRTMKLQLKQLLELGGFDEMTIVIPEIDEELVLKPIGSLPEIYQTSLQTMPEIKNSRIDSLAAAIETTKAKAGYIPTIKLNAGIGSGHSTAVEYSAGQQMKDGFNENVGISISIPILSNREHKTAVEKARINEQTAALNITDAQKSLQTELESVYNDAIAAQNQYLAAKEQLRSLTISYDLIQQQFDLGMKNTLELLTEKNNYLTAQQSLIQAKYMSVINSQLLNLYQAKALEIQ